MRMLAPFVAGVAAALVAVFAIGAFNSDSDRTAQAEVVDDCILILDLNGDGVLDVNDVLTMKDAIENQDPAYDFNDDGVVDVFDVVALVQKVVDCLQEFQPGIPEPPNGQP